MMPPGDQPLQAAVTCWGPQESKSCKSHVCTILQAVYLWLFILTVQLFFMIIYPVAIAPLFNKFVPLAPGTLR